MSLFTNKALMVTGSFGNIVLNRFLHTDIGEIRAFSRDEKNRVIFVTISGFAYQRSLIE